MKMTSIYLVAARQQVRLFANAWLDSDSLRCRTVPTVQRVHGALDLLDRRHEPLHNSGVDLEDGLPLGEPPDGNAHGLVFCFPSL